MPVKAWMDPYYLRWVFFDGFSALGGKVVSTVNRAWACGIRISVPYYCTGLCREDLSAPSRPESKEGKTDIHSQGEKVPKGMIERHTFLVQHFASWRSSTSSISTSNHLNIMPKSYQQLRPGRRQR